MNELNEKLSDLTQLARLKNYIDKQKEERSNKAFIIVLGVVLGILVISGSVAVALTLIKRKKKRCSCVFDDDFDDYFDDECPDDFPDAYEMRAKMDEAEESKEDEVKTASEDEEKDEESEKTE